MSVKIIAEAGVNHNGNLKNAFRLVDVAANAGADIVKFQSFSAERLVTRSAEKADYQKVTTGNAQNQLHMLRDLELSKEDHISLRDYCNEKKIEFLSTPFDEHSADLLFDIGVQKIKIASGEITNLPFLRHVSSFKLPLIVSTGMSTNAEISDCLDVIFNQGVEPNQVTLLHCNTQYPTPMVDVNLHVMRSLKENFKVEVGYSDHTEGIEVPIAAAALGAQILEKHITLDRSLPGPDHVASLESKDLMLMIAAIRNIELALGSDEKKVTPSEEVNRKVIRKSIAAKKFIKKGTLFCEDNICSKRPGTGISPMEYDGVLGLAAKRDFEEDELIEI